MRAGVPNVPGGAIIEIARLSRLSPAARPRLAAARRRCSNALPVAPPLFGFNENIPLRDQPPVTTPWRERWRSRS